MRAPFGPENRPSGEAKAFGRAVAAELRARVAERAAEIVEAQLGRALDPLHPQGHAAAVDLLNRIMPPETKATLAGDPDAPVAITRIERIIIEPKHFFVLLPQKMLSEKYDKNVCNFFASRKND